MLLLCFLWLQCSETVSPYTPCRNLNSELVTGMNKINTFSHYLAEHLEEMTLFRKLHVTSKSGFVSTKSYYISGIKLRNEHPLSSMCGVLGFFFFLFMTYIQSLRHQKNRYICTSACRCTECMYAYQIQTVKFVKGVLAFFHYSFFSFLSTFPILLPSPRKLSFDSVLHSGKEKSMQYFTLKMKFNTDHVTSYFFQLWMFDLLTSPNFVAI